MVLVASSLNCPTKPFCIPFTEANNITRIKIAQPTEKPVKKVRSLLVLMVLNISCQTSLSNILGRPYLFDCLVLHDHTVLEMYDSLAHMGHVLLVGHHQNGVPFVVYLLNQVHHLIRGGTVQGTCGLIGQKYFGFGRH